MTNAPQRESEYMCQPILVAHLSPCSVCMCAFVFTSHKPANYCHSVAYCVSCTLSLWAQWAFGRGLSHFPCTEPFTVCHQHLCVHFWGLLLGAKVYAVSAACPGKYLKASLTHHCNNSLCFVHEFVQQMPAVPAILDYMCLMACLWPTNMMACLFMVAVQ